MAQDALIGKIAGQDSSVLISDSSGNEYRLTAASGYLNATKNGSTFTLGGLQKISAKTADYTVLQADNGTTFTNRGAAGAVIFTLPAAPTTGTWYRFFTCVLAQDVTITAGAADTMTVFNDLTADSIAFSTASERAGNGVEVVWDGTGWLTFVYLGTETATPTIAT